MDGTFTLWMDLWKSNPDDELDSGYRHRGVASVETPDFEGETALVKGMDTSYFRDRGYFNWDHQPGPENLVGEPTRVEVTKLGAVPGYQVRPHQTGHEPCVYVEGVLYKGVARAERVWELMKALAKSDTGATRGLGYSVEGGTLMRRGMVLEKTIVQNIAITHKPTHFDTIALAKSMGCGTAECGGRADMEFESLGQLVTELKRPAPTRMDLYKSLVLGTTKCGRGHLAPGGNQFVGGPTGMLKHLVECAGWTPESAKNHVVSLHKALGYPAAGAARKGN